MARNKRGNAVYAIFIAVYVLILFGLILFGYKRVWTYAKEYEAARPNHAIEEYMEQLQQNLWDQGIADTVKAMPHEMQTDEEVAELVKDLLRTGLSYARLPGSESDVSLTYNLLCNGNVFGKVRIVQDESKADEVEYGMLPWKVAKEEFDFTGLYSTIKVTVPETYRVSLNGHMLGEEYIVERGIHYDVLDAFYEDFPSLPTKVTYQYDYVIGHIDPVIYDGYGNETVIDNTRDDSQYIDPPTEEQYARFYDFSYAFSEAYLAFGTNKDFYAAYARVQPYVQAGSDLDKRLKMLQDGYSWAHTQGYWLNSETLNAAYALGGNIYVLDITADTTVYYPGKGTDGTVQNTNNMKVFVTDSGSDIRAIAVENY